MTYVTARSRAWEHFFSKVRHRARSLHASARKHETRHNAKSGNREEYYGDGSFNEVYFGNRRSEARGETPHGTRSRRRLEALELRRANHCDGDRGVVGGHDLVAGHTHRPLRPFAFLAQNRLGQARLHEDRRARSRRATSISGTFDIGRRCRKVRRGNYSLTPFPRPMPCLI